MHLDEVSGVLVKESEECAHLLLVAPHVHRLGQQGHEGVEVDPVVVLSLDLREVSDSLKNFEQKRLFFLYVDCLQVMEELVEGDLLICSVHVALEGILQEFNFMLRNIKF